MNFYTVKQIANMLKTNEETVRRWIRSGKLVASQNSKKGGNIVSSDSLNQFIKKTPKYAPIIAASLTTTPMALSVVIGGLLSGLIALKDEKKGNVSEADVEVFLKKKISLHEKNIKRKNVELEKLQMEIEEERENLDKYKYALNNLDLKLIASEMSK